MCILFIAVQQHPQYPLIMAANRDEFYARPTAESQFWAGHPHLLAGQDLQSGGTWMGINKDGHLAALTNFRDPSLVRDDAPSRGHLVSDYLIKPIANYREQLITHAQDYNGYNLLYGHWQSLHVYNNVSNQHVDLTPGVYGLSNAMLDTPWPKLSQGVEQLKQALDYSETELENALFNVLSNESLAADHDLPDTGVGHEIEKALSSIFINLEHYGTRSSTILLIDNNSEVHWREKTYASDGNVLSQQQYRFTI